MTRRYKILMIAAVVFLICNVGGAAVALMSWELTHAGIHAALALVTALAIGQLAARRVERY